MMLGRPIVRDLHAEEQHQKRLKASEKPVKLSPLKRNICLAFGCCFFLIAVVMVTSLSVNMNIGTDNTEVSDFLTNQNMINAYKAGKMKPEANMDSTEAKGLEKMMQSRVVIAALARNVETKLPSILRQIQRLSNYFKETRIIIAEGDSADDSAKVLNDWVQLDYKRRVLLNTSGLMNAVESSGPFANSPLPREGRLSRARNAIIDYLREHAQPPQQQEDYVLVLDLDVMGFDLNGIVHSFGHHDQWDGVCAHGIMMHGVYRDTYSLRIKEPHDINTNHHWCGDDNALYNITAEQKVSYRERLETSQRLARTVMNNSPDNSEGIVGVRGSPTGSTYIRKLLKVDSCYGGLAIYKYKPYTGCQYDYRQKEPPYITDCEHVLFNQCLAKGNDGFKLRANFQMKLWYGHTALSDVKMDKIDKVVGSVWKYVTSG